MQVVVNSPPDLYDSRDRREFQQMIDDFENTEYTMRHNATMLWLDAYEKKLKEDHESIITAVCRLLCSAGNLFHFRIDFILEQIFQKVRKMPVLSGTCVSVW
ncbi:unnamed protein product [Gongylonema pulchrum]|uniref:Kinesin motor domain-containing protein n=1 Tax=Gongylonema pulchrum TaxID=637853 RepID=A0A183DJ45_9BILA|nr:unnamed protein product [Gongylonema pulchrum]